jgi:HPt (histidine-containing phosphotransfer) domain-containing protein
VTNKPVTAARLRSAIAEGMQEAAAHLSPPPAGTVMPRISELAAELGEEAVREILAAFVEDIGANLRSMQDAAAQGDTRAVYRLAHSVSGAARNVGADALATRAAGLERSIGLLIPAAIAVEIKAMQGDFEAAAAEIKGMMAAVA